MSEKRRNGGSYDEEHPIDEMEEDMGMGQVDEMDEEMNADMDAYGVRYIFIH